MAKSGHKTAAVYQLTLGALYVAFFALAGNVPFLSAIQLIPGVPITLQVFLVAMMGLTLGVRGGLTSLGAVWEVGVGGDTTVNLDTVGYTYPVWEVNGPAQQPTLTNYITGQTMAYNGNLVEGQKLVVDMAAQTAYLNGLSVLGNLEGDWVALAPGQNTLSYTVAAGESESSFLRWNGVLG